MANNPDGARESYHEVPARKYLFLYNTAIHKRFFKYYTLILITTTYLATRLFSLDQWLLAATTSWILANPVWFGFSCAILVTVGVIDHQLKGRAKRIQRRLQQAQRQPQQQAEVNNK